MGSNGKANKAADHGKDPVIIIENKMTKVDPTFHDDQEVTKSKMVPSECESTDESCYLKCGKTLHSKPAQVRLIYQNVKYLHFIFTIETAKIFTIFLIEIGSYQFRLALLESRIRCWISALNMHSEISAFRAKKIMINFGPECEFYKSLLKPKCFSQF